MIRNQQQVELTDILIRDKTAGNPFAAGPEGGALENFYIDQGKLVRASFQPKFHTSASSSKVWAIKEFNFTRDNATEQQLLIFKSNGKIYRRRGGEETQIFPPPTYSTSYGVSSSASTQGYCGTAASSNTSALKPDWANATNAQGADDSTFATATTTNVGAKLTTETIDATNFGLSPTLTPAGIVVVVDLTYVPSVSDTGEIFAQLRYNGSLIGIPQSATFTSNASTFAVTLGGESFSWGASLSNAIIADSTFGVSIYCTTSDAGGAETKTGGTFSIDSVRIASYGTSTTNTSTTVNFSPLVRKPAVAQINNRLHVSDGAQYLIWDGWVWVNGGITPPVAFASGNLTLSGTGLTGSYIISLTGVHIRSNGGTDIRVHESDRTGLISIVPANQSIVVSNSGIGFAPRCTHWSIYMSEVAGSFVYRRVITLPLSTTSYTISAEPSAVAPVAPIRNDPVLPSRILTQWKNRVAARSETNPDRLKFTAFGEVNGLLNGAGEECMPGALGTTSISDLVNEWQIPDGGQPMQCAVYHRELLYVFTDRNGFYIQGEGALLDNTGVRDFLPQNAASFGAAGPSAALSTPFGLAVVSKEHKLWLLKAPGQEPIDIGHDIQDRLDDLTSDELNDIEMCYWSGEGWDWMLVPLHDRTEIFDFSLTSEKAPYGSFISLGSQNALPQPTAYCVYHPNRKFLLSGHTDGSVHQLAQLCQPSHLGLSCVLGQTYLSSSVQSSPIAIARTGPLTADSGKWTELKYAQYYHRGHTDTSSISASNPVVKAYYDQTDPANPASGVTLTSATVSGSNERRAWFAPSSTASAAGALAREAHLELKWTATDTDGQSRPQLVNNEVLKIGIASIAKGTTVR